jgi:predicted heme/steroid binding protein
MKLFIILISSVGLLFLSACSSNDFEPIPTEDQVEMTLEELALFDGRNGNKAYVAVNGIIYDVTNSSLWSNGGHNGFRAGQDLSVAIMSSPHGLSTLERLPVVGTLVSSSQ